MDTGKLLFEKIETEAAFKWLLYLRLALLLLALVTNPWRTSIPREMMQLFEFAGIGAAAYNIAVLLFHRRIAGMLQKRPLLQYVDLVLSCAIICIGCGWRSSYWGYTVSSIILGTLFDRTRGAWIASALLAAIALFVNPLVCYSDFRFDTPQWDMRIGAAIFYAGIGAFFGYFSKVIRRIHALKKEKLEEVRKATIADHKIAVAHDLHDGIRAKMTAILLIAKGLVDKHRRFDPPVQSDLLKLWRWLNYTQTELSQFVDSLQMHSLLQTARTFDMASLLRDEAKIIQDMTGFVWNVQARSPEIHYPLECKHNILNFCGEAMTNAWKHSGVRNGAVIICEKEDSITIEIIDEGKGFDPNDRKTGTTLGLKSLAKRADELEAVCSVESEPGKGCVVALRLKRASAFSGDPSQTNSRSS